MRVTVAENAGFCFGVRRAAEALERALEEARPGERVCTLGHLIHNETYNERMRARCSDGGRGGSPCACRWSNAGMSGLRVDPRPRDPAVDTAGTGAICR